MILSISLALIVSGALLVALHRTEIPEIPIYLLSGIILSYLTSLASSAGIVSHGIVETKVMREIALLGLSILIFYRTSGMLIDPNRSTAVDSFKASILTSSIMFAGVTGVSLYLEFKTTAALLFGITASIGSTLLDSGIVKEEARKNHIYGWLTEDINFYDDVLGIVVLTTVISTLTGVGFLHALIISLSVIFLGLILRKPFSKAMMKITGGENELVLLSGISTLISAIWITESAGISAMEGVYAAGLMMVNTKLGFHIRERFSSVKDFFTALSFISVGYLLSIPSTVEILIAGIIIVGVMVIRPIFSTVILSLLGYDLRSSFMGSIQFAQISEIAVVAALILAPLTSSPVLEVVTLSFAVSITIAHTVQDHKQGIFETIFSDYELDSEKSYIPEDLEEHVILAGYDWKTKGIEKDTGKDVVAVDFSFERIEEASDRNIPHLLADLHSDKAWKKVDVEDASVVVCAINDEELINSIEEMEVEADKILVRKDSDQVREQIRNMLRDSLE